MTLKTKYIFMYIYKKKSLGFTMLDSKLAIATIIYLYTLQNNHLNHNSQFCHKAHQVVHLIQIEYINIYNEKAQISKSKKIDQKLVSVSLLPYTVHCAQLVLKNKILLMICQK